MHQSNLARPDVPGTDIKGHRGPLQYRCGYCSKIALKLSFCSGCNVVRYCSKDHQILHRPQHNSACIKTKKRRTKLAKKEELFRNATPNFTTSANASASNIRHSWALLSVLSTRDDTIAKLDLAETIRSLHTLDGVQEALAHLRDILRLCRGNNVGVQDLIAPIMLQLDLDQECCNFVKWYETEGQRSNYHGGNMNLPCLDANSANALESIDYMDQTSGSVYSISTIMLLKLKLLVDV